MVWGSQMPRASFCPFPQAAAETVVSSLYFYCSLLFFYVLIFLKLCPDSFLNPQQPYNTSKNAVKVRHLQLRMPSLLQHVVSAVSQTKNQHVVDLVFVLLDIAVVGVFV